MAAVRMDVFSLQAAAGELHHGLKHFGYSVVRLRIET